MQGLKNLRPQAIIFDKDGTLIDFDAMWGGWSVFLADQLKTVSGLNVHAALYQALGYDPFTRKVLAGGKLASRPMAYLRAATVEVVQSLGLSPLQAEQIVEAAWFIPDPVMLARPLADLRSLFGELQRQGIRIAIATADDRAPTQAMIEALDIEEYIATMVCADDGVPSKPAPDMVLTICKRLNIPPAKVMVIGDTASDLKMARAAGAGLAVGVLSGVSKVPDLIAHADVILDSIGDIVTHPVLAANFSPPNLNTDLNLDPA